MWVLAALAGLLFLVLYLYAGTALLLGMSVDDPCWGLESWTRDLSWEDAIPAGRRAAAHLAALAVMVAWPLMLLLARPAAEESAEDAGGHRDGKVA